LHPHPPEELDPPLDVLASVVPPSPPSPASIAVTPASTGAAPQVPIALVVELHTSPAGHPLPPVPRQPGVHALVAVLHTRSDVGPPQSLSCVQPHVSDARHVAPVPFALQFLVSCVVHCTQWFFASQTWGIPFAPGQSESLMHWTQTCGCPSVSHTGVGAWQSVLLLQGSLVQVPTEPLLPLQYSPVAQLSVPLTTRHPAVQVPEATLDVSQ
jgi:hypothetical protein